MIRFQIKAALFLLPVMTGQFLAMPIANGNRFQKVTRTRATCAIIFQGIRLINHD